MPARLRSDRSSSLLRGRFPESCQQDIQVAHLAQPPGQPLQFGLELFAPSAVDQVFQRPQLAAKATGRGAEAMNALGITAAGIGVSSRDPQRPPPLSTEKTTSPTGSSASTRGRASVTGALNSRPSVRPTGSATRLDSVSMRHDHGRGHQTIRGTLLSELGQLSRRLDEPARSMPRPFRTTGGFNLA